MSKRRKPFTWIDLSEPGRVRGFIASPNLVLPKQAGGEGLQGTARSVAGDRATIRIGSVDDSPSPVVEE